MVRSALPALPALISAALACAACGRDHGSAHVRPLPKPDGSPALRGGGAARSPRIANYKIDARLDVATHQITATQTLTWTNAGGTAVDKLPFHLYLNGFKNESTTFMRSWHSIEREAPTENWGWIHVDQVSLGGADLTAKWTAGSDESVAELALPAPVEPGGTVKLDMKFTAQLPEVFARTGYKGEFHLVGQWFPKIGVRVGPTGSERWECQPFHAFTEFFADFGVYDVSITVPNTYAVAGTGVLAAATESPGGSRTLTYHAEDVHDFVWMADPYMEVTSGQAKLEDGTVEVRVLARPEQKEFARRHLEAAVGAIQHFSAWFVPYPWPIMTIVDPPMDAVGGAGGMEYPTLVTTSGDSVYARPGLRLPEYVTVHEVGHNWFQGILASNEAVEAWLDEGVNEWADGRVMNEMYGARTSGIDWMGWQAEVAALRRAFVDNPGALPSPIASAAFAFVDGRTYGEATYAKTAAALSTLEQYVGPSKFAEAMKAYAQAWAFKHPTGRDLFESLSTKLGEDLTWFFGPVWQSVGGLKLGIRTAECRDAHAPRGVFGDGPGKKLVTPNDAPNTGSYVCEVVVTSTGVIHVPIDLELRYADDSTERVRWDDKGHGAWERFVIERSTPLVEVWIDPDNKLALDAPTTHRYRIDGDGAASLRAAAWVASVAQTLMQAVGPSTMPPAKLGMRLGLGELFSAGGRGVSKYTGTLLGVFVAQSLLAAALIIPVSMVLAQVFSHLPMFDEALDGDLIAIVWCLRHGKTAWLAVVSIVIGALVLWQLASWFLAGGLYGVLAQRPETRGDTARCFGASGASTYLAYARLALCSIPGWIIVLFVFGSTLGASANKLEHALTVPELLGPLAMVIIPTLALVMFFWTVADYARVELTLRHDTHGPGVVMTYFRTLIWVAKRPLSVLHAGFGWFAFLLVTLMYLYLAQGHPMYGTEGAITLFAVRQGVSLLRMALRVGVMAGQVELGRTRPLPPKRVEVKAESKD